MIIDIEAFTPIRNTLNANNLKFFLKEYLVDQRINNNFNFKNISSINNIRDNSILFMKDNTDIILNEKNCHIITDSSDVFHNKKFNNITKVSNLNISNIKIINHLFIHEDQIDFIDDFDYLNNSYISKLA